MFFFVKSTCNPESQMRVISIFTHLQLCRATPTHSFKRTTKTDIWSSICNVNLLVNPLFHVQNLRFDVRLKMNNNDFTRDMCSTLTTLSYFLFNPLTTKLFSFNFHPLDVVSRWRDPQLQVSENYSDLTKGRSTVFKYCWLMSHFIFSIFKMWCLMCK